MKPAENGPKTAMGEHKGSTCLHGPIQGSVSLARAVEFSGIEAKRLRGRIFRGSTLLNDPVGCAECGQVMLWSLTRGAPQVAGPAVTPQ